MKKLECMIFNVEHGFCAFIKSPNDYGLMIDCGERLGFSPIKWVRQHYNYGNGNIEYFEGRRIAELVLTHLHADHFSDVGSFHGPAKDRPKILNRDKKTLKFIDEKIKEEKDSSRRKLLQNFKKFQAKYDQDVKSKPDWGFDFFDTYQISYDDAVDINENRDKIINNRSYLIGIEYAGKKILIPGDIEEDGWEKAFGYSRVRKILKGTNFLVTSHHGRESGCNSNMLKYTGIPDIYIVSARARDDGTFYQFYSNPKNSKGYMVTGDDKPSHVVSTKKRNRSLKLVIDEYGRTKIVPLYTTQNLNENQQRLRGRRTKQFTKTMNLRKVISY
jgi:hypothetical protein